MSTKNRPCEGCGDETQLCSHCDGCEDCCDCRECEQCWAPIADWDPACWDCYSCSDCCYCDDVCVDCGGYTPENKEGKDGEMYCPDCMDNNETRCPNCLEPVELTLAGTTTTCSYCLCRYGWDQLRSRWDLLSPINEPGLPKFVTSREMEERVAIYRATNSSSTYPPRDLVGNTPDGKAEQMAVVHEFNKEALLNELEHVKVVAEEDRALTNQLNEASEQWLRKAVDEALAEGKFTTLEGKKVDCDGYSPGGRVKLVGDYSQRFDPSVSDAKLVHLERAITKLTAVDGDTVSLTDQDYQTWIGQWVETADTVQQHIDQYSGQLDRLNSTEEEAF